MRWGFVLCAALLGCANSDDNTSASRPTAATAVSVQPAPSLPSSGVELIPNVAFVKLRINTNPDGASVKEDGYEVCNSTPCEVTYRGAIDADLAKDHKLLISKTGYKVESKTVRIGDSPITVKLTRAPAQRTPPPPPQQPGKSNDEWQHYQ